MFQTIFVYKNNCDRKKNVRLSNMQKIMNITSRHLFANLEYLKVKNGLLKIRF